MIYMMSLQNKLQLLADTLTPLCDNVYHYRRADEQIPCIIWQEDGEDGRFNADNIKQRQVISGTVDYFTKVEFDPIVDRIQSAFNELQKQTVFAWELNSVQYEEDTNLIHHEWRFSI